MLLLTSINLSHPIWPLLYHYTRGDEQIWQEGGVNVQKNFNCYVVCAYKYPQ